MKDAHNWNPRPPESPLGINRRDYMAGYSDGFHGYSFGDGHREALGNRYYLRGFDHGLDDAAKGKPAGCKK